MTSPTTVADYWTTRAEGYSDRTADELAGPRGLIWEKRLRDALHTAPEGLVVDLGCGPGLFTLLAARTGREALGIDLTPKMLRQARTNHRRFAPQSSVSFLAADAELLPLADHSVAAVVSRYVIWNLPHPEAALLEIKRVLKPAGVLYYVDGNHYRYLTDPRWAKLHAVQTPVYGHEARFVKGVDTSPMERMARELPLTYAERPQWDETVLTRLGFRSVCIRTLDTQAASADDPHLITEFSIEAHA